MGDTEDDDSSAMDLLNDITCVLCRQMDNPSNNQLFECIVCHQLFHQFCHATKIPNDACQTSWTCSTCIGKKEGSSTKSNESSSSSPNSSSYKHKEKSKSSTEKKKDEKRSSSSSSKSQKKSKESSSSSSSRSRSSKKSS